MTPRITRLWRRWREDRRGVTIIEFAIIAPTMMLLLMGSGDVLYQAYAQSILNGALQKAGRDSGIQGNDTQGDSIDAKVIGMVGQIVRNPTNACPATGTTATWCSTRESYDTFTEVAPEPFTDTNGNGERDPGECFTDVNGNGSWDADPGTTGQGGANDVTLYTMSVTYPRLFPVTGMLGGSNMATITASTLLKNQPYASQTTTTNTTICT